MSVTTHGSKSQSYSDASMDDILASIRKIIAEEPLSFRHRRTEADLAEAGGRSARHRRTAPNAIPGSAGDNQPTAPAAQGTGAVRVLRDDSVLTELLADGARPVPGPGGARLLDNAQPLISTDAMQPPSEAPDTTAKAETASAPDGQANAFLTPPESEVRAAASVLDALAAGLAAAKAPSLIPEELSAASATPAALAETTFDATSAAAPIASDAVADAEDMPSAAVTVTAAPPVSAPQPAADAVPSSETSDVVTTVSVAGAPEPQQAVSGPLSFEDTIAGMLRPLLREWLDANLPRMVEKALRDELGATGHEEPAPAVPATSASGGRRYYGRRAAASKAHAD